MYVDALKFKFPPIGSRNPAFFFFCPLMFILHTGLMDCDDIMIVDFYLGRHFIAHQPQIWRKDKKHNTCFCLFVLFFYFLNFIMIFLFKSKTLWTEKVQQFCLEEYLQLKIPIILVSFICAGH